MTDQHPKPELPPGLALAWGRATAPRRGPKPGHSIQEIVKAAVNLADAHGIDALSLPNIAGSVGLSTNALYHYVGSKDELLVLVCDAAWGQPPAACFCAGRWRKRARAWTVAVIEGYRKRPWLLDIPLRGAPMTPNALRWLEVLLQGLSGSALNGQDLLRCALLLDGYARSVVRLSRDLSSGGRNAGQAAAVDAFLLPLLQQHEYPILASMTGAQSKLKGSASDDIEFGIERILDGIGVLVAARKM